MLSSREKRYYFTVIGIIIIILETGFLILTLLAKKGSSFQTVSTSTPPTILSWPTRIGPTKNLHSDVAKHIFRHQNNCSIKPILYNLNHAGLGSDIHVFSQTVAKYINKDRRVA